MRALRWIFYNFTRRHNYADQFMNRPFTIIFAFASVLATAQDLPYREIPAPPDNYTAGAVASRMLDGLGFRFYWATEGLRPEDLAFKPGPNTRTSEETVAHIYGMSFIILNATKKSTNVSGQDVKLP